MKFKIGDRVKFVGNVINDLKPGNTGKVIEFVEGDTWDYVHSTKKERVNNDMYVVEWEQKVEDEYLICTEWLEASND